MKWAMLMIIFMAVPSSFAYCGRDFGIDYKMNDGKVMFSFSISPKLSDFEIEYWIENEKGNVIKPKRNTTSLGKKTFTPPKNVKSMMIKAVFFGVEGEECAAEEKVDVDESRDLGIRMSIKGKGTKGPANNPPEFRNEKMKGVVPFFIILALGLVSIVLIWRR